MLNSPFHIFVLFASAWLIFLPRAGFGATLLSDGFETDPLLSGWTRSGSGAAWIGTALRQPSPRSRHDRALSAASG